MYSSTTPFNLQSESTPSYHKNNCRSNWQDRMGKGPEQKNRSKDRKHSIIHRRGKNAGIVPFHICFNIFEIEKKKNKKKSENWTFVDIFWKLAWLNWFKRGSEIWDIFLNVRDSHPMRFLPYWRSNDIHTCRSLKYSGISTASSLGNLFQ